MSHPAPWRLLVHGPGRGAGDPKFILCLVAAPGDVRLAGPIVDGVDDVTARWVATRHGVPHVQLIRLPRAAVWLVIEYLEEASSR